jgi:hypothetical protein
MNAVERFTAKYQVNEDGCWIWTAGINSEGYGSFWDGKRNVRAHRFSYELAVEPIPEGMQIDHLCRVRNCVNPEHLEPVTNHENARRGNAGIHMRETLGARTHCVHGHEFTPENTYLGAGWRRCRKCNALTVWARRHGTTLAEVLAADTPTTATAEGSEG